MSAGTIIKACWPLRRSGCCDHSDAGGLVKSSEAGKCEACLGKYLDGDNHYLVDRWRCSKGSEDVTDNVVHESSVIGQVEGFPLRGWWLFSLRKVIV